MEQTSTWIGFQWILITIGGLLSLFGIKKLSELAFADWLADRKEKRQIHDTTKGKQIDADTLEKDRWAARIVKLEASVEGLTEKLMYLTATNATLSAENKYLKETNASQEIKIAEQSAKIEMLSQELHIVMAKFEALKVQFAAIDPHTDTTRLLETAEQAERLALRMRTVWKEKECTPVLIIDDDADSRAILAECLQLEGIASKSFDAETDALKWLDESHACVIVLDLGLKTLDGFAMAGHIRTNEMRFDGRPTAHIAFYTGRPVDAVVKLVADRNKIRRTFEKGKDLPADVAFEIKKWLNEG